jgi:hypothetical protein
MIFRSTARLCQGLGRQQPEHGSQKRFRGLQLHRYTGQRLTREDAVGSVSEPHRKGGYETKVWDMTGNAELGRDVEEGSIPNECAETHVHAAQEAV